MTQIYSKLNVKNRVHLALYAHKAGYVTLDEIDFGVCEDAENQSHPVAVDASIHRK